MAKSKTGEAWAEEGPTPIEAQPLSVSAWRPKPLAPVWPLAPAPTRKAQRKAQRKAERQAQRGASAAEFLVVMPVGLLLVLGIVQTGLAYVAKLNANHAAFMAARAGSLHHANVGVIQEAFERTIAPQHGNLGPGRDLVRRYAHTRAQMIEDGLVTDGHSSPRAPLVKVDILNPSAASFRDFGIKDDAKGVYYIPNDNLEHRRVGDGYIGTTSKQNIRDANLLRVKITYAYELKVPLMAELVEKAMCLVGDGSSADPLTPLRSTTATASSDCELYYKHGRMPIVSHALVEMHTRAESPSGGGGSLGSAPAPRGQAPAGDPGTLAARRAAPGAGKGPRRRQAQ